MPPAVSVASAASLQIVGPMLYRRTMNLLVLRTLSYNSCYWYLTAWIPVFYFHTKCCCVCYCVVCAAAAVVSREAGSGGVPVHPEKLHFSPYHQGPPQPNEMMPPAVAEED